MVGSAGGGARIDGRRGADPSDAPDAGVAAGLEWALAHAALARS